MKILQEEQHSILAMAYDEITRDRQNMAISITTRSAAHGELTSIYANSQEPLDLETPESSYKKINTITNF